MEKKVLSKRDIGDGIQTTIQLSNTDKSKITTEEIGQIVNRFSTGGNKIMVRALNIERWMTIKGMQEEFDPESFIDYYVNKVKEADVDKFTEFMQIQVTIFKPKRNQN
jgi:capsule polysaccharide export protein KpsE/RkpR